MSNQVDPALDHAGRLQTFLDRSIAELKPKDAAAVSETETQTIAPADVGNVTAVLPVVTPVAAAPAKPASPASANKASLAVRAVAAVMKKMDVRADRVIARAGLASAKVDATFDKQEDALANSEALMDQLDASLSQVGNEDPNEA